MIDFSRFPEIHELCCKAMVGWSVRYVEADGSWEFSIQSQAPSEDWDYDGSFGLGVQAIISRLHSMT